MSTLADELLNDFEDSGSEGESEQQNGFLQDSSTPPTVNDRAHALEGSMVLDGDEEDVDEDDEMADGGAPVNGAVADVEDEEEAKVKVEKMQLGGVNDVRNVAGLMKTLEPVLEVCDFSCLSPCSTNRPSFTSLMDIALTFFVASRKSPISRTYQMANRLSSWARSKTILNTISLRSLIPFRPLSTTRSSSSINTFETTTLPASLSSKRLLRTLWITRSQWQL